MTTEYSIQKMVSDGTLSTIALGIQYLQRNDIYVRIAGEETPQSGAPSGYTWAFINSTTLKILPLVPNGVEVVVYRRTDIGAMYNIYSQNAQFDEATIDENNQQLLYIAQEYLEQGIPGAGVDIIEFIWDDGSFTYYRIKRTDGSYSDEFAVPSASSSTKVLTREALRRSYAEAGYNLVAGSFESGGKLVNANDVLLQERTGKGFSGPAGTVAAGTNPASGGFVDKSGGLLRHELATSASAISNANGGSVQDFIDTTESELATIHDDITHISLDVNDIDSRSTSNSVSISALQTQNATQDNRLNAVESGQGAGVIGYATQAELFANLNFDAGSIGYVTNDTTATKNGTYRKSGASGAGSWIQSSSDLASQAYASSLSNKNFLESNLAAHRNTTVDEIDIDALTGAEIKVIESVSDIYIKSDVDDIFRLTLIKTGDTISSLRLNNLAATNFITLHTSPYTESGNIRTYTQSVHFQGEIYTASVSIDMRVGDVNYSYNPVSAPNLLYKTSKQKVATDSIGALHQQGIITLHKDDSGSPVLNDKSMFMKFTINEPCIIGSVDVDVTKLPLSQPAYIEAGIYPPDNGLGTSKRISTSRQLQITKLGSLRLPLEQKLLMPGNVYSIGFKTNAGDCLATVSGVESFRLYDAAGGMSTNAPNLRYPITDKYGAFVAFNLSATTDYIKPQKPDNWSVTYDPEYSFLGQDELGKNVYLYQAGPNTSKFYLSSDGGLTKSKMHSNIIQDADIPYSTVGYISTAVVRYDNGGAQIYAATSKGYQFKFDITSEGIASVIDITTPNKSTSLSKLVVSSYAPIVDWKGFIWWGEYQDPATPRLHKYEIATGQWYISIEKPTSGPDGARHVHYLYKSPIDSDVLWSVWGDASNGAGQGISKLTVTSETAGTGLDSWVQHTTGVERTTGESLPYPTAILEIYEGINGKIGKNEPYLICAGDQPPTHLLKCGVSGLNEGEYLMQPLNFKQESAPDTETVHWLAIDESKTIYYMTVESRPRMSIYASPYPYTRSFRISKYWQQAIAGNIAYSNGYIQTRNHRFPKVAFVNTLDFTNVSKVPYLPSADETTIVERFNKLLENLQGANILQTRGERGNDKDSAFWADDSGKWDNWN